MNNSEYIFATIAAIALLVLFPVYWVGLISSGMFNSGYEFYRSAIEFSKLDILFLLVGALTIYVYLSLKRLLNQRYSFSDADIPLYLLIATTVIYVFGLVGLDFIMSIFGHSLGLSSHKFVLNANLVVGIGSMLVFGVADILLGVVLLKSAISDSSIIKALGVVVIIQGFIEITIVFSASLIVIFPITLIIIALLFAHKPKMLEVI